MEFFNSVTNICKLYSIQEPDVTGLIFPQNVQIAYQKINELFDDRNELKLKIMQDGGHDACLATLKTYDTGYRLYYIPVKPICLLSTVEELQPLAKLLITVYQYLFQVIDVTYYREPGYLNFIYETIENWIDEDEDGEDEDYRKYQRSEFEQMNIAGDSLLRVLKERFHIGTMELLLKEYRDCVDWDMEADCLVQEFVKLAKDYPGRSIKHSIPYNVYLTGENDLICLEHYLSFYWSGLDGFQEMIDDMVNNELQEMGYQEEPVAVQWFDKPQANEQHDFDFEVRLFALLNELIDLVNEYDHEKYNK